MNRDVARPMSSKATNNADTNNTPTKLANTMPPNTVVPIDRLDPAPAPDATTSGIMPTMKASDVIITAR